MYNNRLLTNDRLTSAANGSCASLPFKLCALSLLVAFGLVLRVKGFRGLAYVMTQWHTTGAVDDADALRTATEVVDAVTWAATHTLRRARCLQTAATTTCLLRLHGVPAQFVIGVRPTPFRAHAWTEVNGLIVGARERYTDTYTVIHRC